MKFSIFKYLLDQKRFGSVGYLPRWIIFAIDVGLVLVANVFTYLIVSSLTVDFYEHLNMPARYALIIFVNAFFFVMYRTYAGIIRHSTFIDGVKLLVSTSTAFAFLVCVNYGWYIAFGQKVYLTTALFISYVISFLFLFLFRILVKRLFERYANVTDAKKLISTVIYGADANAISVANALRTEVPSRFKLRGFIDKFHHEATSKRILNLPIASQNKSIHVIMRAMKAEALIIAEKGLTHEETVKIVEECLEYNFKVYTVPVVADWADSQLISKKVKNFEIEDLLERKPIKLHMDVISRQLKGKKVLITGAAGSIGSEIVRQVLGFKPGHLIMLDQAETPLHTLELEIDAMEKTAMVSAVLADIRNAEALEKVFDEFRPDVVYHAAAYKHVPLMENNPFEAINTNVRGTMNLANLAEQYGVDRFVMVSTDKAVNPSSVMGASKRIAEIYVQSLNLKLRKTGSGDTKFITTRFGNVLGSNGSIVPLFTKQIQEGGPLTITHPEIIRYFMTIPEACQLVLEAGTMGTGGEIYIFDMGEPVKILDLAKKMIRLAGFTPGKDIEIKIIGLRPGEKLFEELLTDTSRSLPTHNDKIMIAVDMVAAGDYEEAHRCITKLANTARAVPADEVVAMMKKIVPEFKSLNSMFETLDAP